MVVELSREQESIDDETVMNEEINFGGHSSLTLPLTRHAKRTGHGHNTKLRNAVKFTAPKVT